MSNKFEVYDLVPPRIWVWRIHDVQDLIEIAESCRVHVKDGFRYYTRGYDYRRGGGTVLESIGLLTYNERHGLHYESYRSAYGDSVDTSYNRVAKVGDALVLNLTIKMGVFLPDLGSATLDAQSLPEEMLRPFLQPIVD